MSELFYFTNTFPLGISANWKMTEIDLLVQSKKFSKIHIVPFIKEGSPSINYVPPKNVIVHPPILNEWPIFSLKIALKILFGKKHFTIITLLVRERAYTNKERFIKFLSAANSALVFLKSDVYKNHLCNNEKDKTLYFFWGVNAAHVVPFLKNKFKKIIVRYHGYDLFFERNNGYIPFRKAQLKKVSLALFVSNQGLNYQKTKFPTISFNAEVVHLPTLTSGITQQGANEIFNILTCSRMVALKRLDILIDALKLIDSHIQITWTHIGDGELYKELINRAKELPAHIKYHFTGWLSADKIEDFYNNNPVDLFINISTTEGLPVSITEALSHGIPILATNVGGTNEAIDNSCGKLIGANITPQTLCENIASFVNMSAAEKKHLKAKASQKYQNQFSLNAIKDKLISNIG